MKQLSQLQQAFQDYVLQAGSYKNIFWVSTQGKADPEARLSCYAFAYRARLKEVLASDYHALLTAIGNEQFEQLADKYIDAHPSRYYSLRDFGRHLPEFVADLILQDHRFTDKHWLHELALFEWTLGQAFDAPDRATLGEHEMAMISAESWPELRFHVHPSVHRMDFEWNIPLIWQTLTSDTKSQVTARLGTSSPWLVWRDHLTIRFRHLQADEQPALDRLIAGGSFQEVCELLATAVSGEEVPMHAAGMLKGWIMSGLICGIIK